MDPISALNIASAVVQFIEFGAKVVKVLAEYSEASQGDIPGPLRNINIRLPLLVNSLSRIQNESEVNRYDFETLSILHGVVLGCLKLVRELDDIAVKIKPRPGDSLGSKLKKVLGNLKSKDRIEDIDRGLQGYIQVLILNQVVDRTEVQAAFTEESQYFVVREKRITNAVAREELINQLDSCLYEAARGQKQNPEVVILQGKEGTGKTQIALSYCYHAYELGQFQSIFWLDASTPTSLNMSLESAAATIRRTIAGTADEKLSFFSHFLTERWHPWLLVLDNYQYEKFTRDPVTRWLPDKGNGAVLITTRNWDMPPLGKVIKVYKFMTDQEELEVRYEATKALQSNDFEAFKSILDDGLSVDSYTCTIWSDKGLPLLNKAAEVGFDKAVQLLLDRGASPHFDRTMDSVLASAAEGGSLSTITIYLSYEDNIGQYLSQADYDWAFHRTFEYGHTEILKLLLKERGQYFTPTSKRVVDGIEKAAENGNLGVLQMLASLKNFPLSDLTRANSLCKAVEKHHLEIVQFLITDTRVDPNIRNVNGCSALYYAASIGIGDTDKSVRDALASILLNAGASPNLERTQDKRTPLHQATSNGSISTMKLLSERGADVTLEDKYERTALLMAINLNLQAAYPLLTNVEIRDANARERYFSIPLFIAARRGDRELVLSLMHKGVLNSVEESTGDTPLLAAIKSGQTPVARMLIRNGAKQSLADKECRVPLYSAAEHNLDLVIKDLCKASDFDGLEVCDKKGNTPLIVAAQAGHKKLVKVLLDLGADPEAMNQFGETALEVAEDKSYEEIVMLLESTKVV